MTNLWIMFPHTGPHFRAALDYNNIPWVECMGHLLAALDPSRHAKIIQRARIRAYGPSRVTENQ